jgi:hypothetical protein
MNIWMIRSKNLMKVTIKVPIQVNTHNILRDNLVDTVKPQIINMQTNKPRNIMNGLLNKRLEYLDANIGDNK